MYRTTRTTLTISALAVLAAVLAVEPALADPGNGNAAASGKNVGQLLGDIAKPLAPAVAGIAGIGAYFRRDTGMTVSLLVITVVVLGFSVAGSQFVDFADSFWTTVL